MQLGGNHVEKNDVELNELIVMDLKRRRVGQEDGPSSLTQKEDAMIISNDENASPKNYLSAGATLQARHIQRLR